MGTMLTWTGSSLSDAPIAAKWVSSNISTLVERSNMTAITEFILLGFQVSQHIKILIFSLFLGVYWFTIFVNLLIIALVSTSKNLQTLMYFFLTQLSISDTMLTTDIVPNLLHTLLYYRRTITFIDCMTQFYFLGTPESSECLLLTVMPYDRYVAICNPLRYSSIITSTYCVILAVTSWFAVFCLYLFLIIIVSMLNFCGPNTIDHFVCDTVPLLELSCSDTYSLQMEVLLLGIPFICIPITIVIFSYAKIIVTILRIPSSTGRQKVFSTCSSHLIVVSILYLSLFSVYVFPTRGRSSTISKILSLLYTVFTPLINPIIYSLKNQEIKKALHNLVYKHLRG